MGFVHLHVHTEYSLLDGACRIEKVLDAAKMMGQSALAITDHGNMYGVIDFYKAAKKRGIKPIIGSEIYIAKRSRHDKVHILDSENAHLVLLCKNEEGYKNLITIVSKAWIEGFYNKPRADEELLRKHSGGLIALSACLSGEIPKALLRDNYNEAREIALKYNEIFGEGNFYLELQFHGIEGQKKVNEGIIRLSSELSIPLVLTNDCHYIYPEDAQMQKVLMCIQTNHTINDNDAMDFGSEEFFLKSESEMRSLFPAIQSAADNTVEIADKCNLEIEFGKTKLPLFIPETGEDSDTYFKRLCYEGLYKKYGENPDKNIMDRLSFEISVVQKMGYVNYYLIVQDYVNYSKTHGIPVGPGRGSGAGSLAAYCIGITNINPIKYNLIFERFLNPERVSMPDFDVDFSDEKRQEVIDYVIKKYGADRVSQIVAFDTMAARAAVRDVGRALGMSYSSVDAVAKQIPRMLKITLDDILNAKKGAPEYSEKFIEAYSSGKEIHELVDMARKIEGMPRHATTHAAGVVITDVPVSEYVPLSKNDEAIVTQYTMTELEELGLIKMDFLGLRNLSIISNAESMIRKNNPDFSVENLPDGDEKTFKMIASGQTYGVFQLESDGMKRLLIRSEPKGIEDLIAAISLYRPGPMSFIPDYIKNKNNPERIKYAHPLLEKILDVTFGCIIYQEQVMQICRELAGYSLGRADIVRRAMSKKKTDVMEKEKQIFIYGLEDKNGNVEVDGCIRRGVDEKTASKLFSEMESFASYAFNKSHAAAYSVLAYQTAYLKAHYPREYMASLLTSVLNETSKVTDYIYECTRMQIKVIPPDINKSQSSFCVSGNNIMFGLLAVRNLGRGLINNLIAEREKNGEFESFYKFCKRMVGKELNKRALESLIKCGAFDSLGNNRCELLSVYANVCDFLDETAKRNVGGQLGFFDIPSMENRDDYDIPKMKDFSVKEKIEMEKEVTGLYLSAHPLDPFRSYYDSSVTSFSALAFDNDTDILEDGKKVNVIGIINSVTVKRTKNEKMMAFVFLEDISGTGEVLFFPDMYEKNSDILQKDKVISVIGRISTSENKDSSVIAQQVKIVEPSEEKKEEKHSSRPGLYLKVRSENDEKYKKAMQYIEVFDGTTPLYVFFSDENKLKAAPKSLSIDINDVLLRELKKLIGNDNVVLIK